VQRGVGQEVLTAEESDERVYCQVDGEERGKQGASFAYCLRGLLSVLRKKLAMCRLPQSMAALTSTARRTPSCAHTRKRSEWQFVTRRSSPQQFRGTFSSPHTSLARNPPTALCPRTHPPTSPPQITEERFQLLIIHLGRPLLLLGSPRIIAPLRPVLLRDLPSPL
jgi:hypothetical protein